MAFTTNVTGQTFSDETLDMDADLIQASSYLFAQDVLKRRQQMDDFCQNDEPLYVVLGETHTCPSHILHHMAVLDEMLEWNDEPVSVVLEQENNTLASVFNAMSGLPYDPELAKKIQGDDWENTGDLFLKSYFSYLGSSHAPYARKFLNTYLLEKDIYRTIAGDVASVDEGDQRYLDIQDPSTAEAARDVMQGRQALIRLEKGSRDGMIVRNRHMVTAMKDTGEHDPSRIVVLICGHNHVAGNGAYSYDFRGSVVGQLLLDKRNVMAHMPLDNGSPWAMPSDAPKRLFDKAVFTWHLPEWRAEYEYRFTGEQVPINGPLQSIDDEMSYCKDMAQRTEIEFDFRSVAAMNDLRASYRTDLDKQYEEWLRASTAAGDATIQIPGSDDDDEGAVVTYRKPRFVLS